MTNTATIQVQDAQRRLKSIAQEFENWKPALKDLSGYVNPVRGIFDGNRTTVGKMMDHKKILSAHATHALRIFASGLNSGMTNKSSNWFRFILGNKEALELPGVKEWIDKVQNAMYDVLNQSNIYEVFYSAYEELGQFGTACFAILDDFDDVIRGRSFTAGEYYLATDKKGNPNAFGRDFEMTVEQLVKEFGLESCSIQVNAYWLNKAYDVKIKVCHLIEENKGRNPEAIDSVNMPFRSLYWESGNHGGQFLRRSGHQKFPIVAPRWDTITTDMVYGYGPGWHSLGAIKELQKTKLDKMLAQEKIHNPPTVKDATVQGYSSLLPGGVTVSSSNLPNVGVRAAYQINPDLNSYLEAINDVKEEIDRFFFVNLFMMLMNVDTGKMTATEVAERQQEKMMMMGPALHRLDKEMLTVVLDLVYSYMDEAGLIPEPPQEVQGATLKIEFTSILAQAQRAMGINHIERVLGIVGTYASIFPNMVDNIDVDEIVREINDMEGAPAKIVLDRDKVEAIRAERQKQQNQAVAMQAASAGADAANKLANAPVGTGSALDGVLAGLPK